MDLASNTNASPDDASGWHLEKHQKFSGDIK
jgi:hypothetical protein